MEISDDLYGLVLAGGESRRMGRDKSMLSYHGVTQRKWVYELLSKFCKRSFISVKILDPEEKLPQVPDKFEFNSPLNGTMSALETFPEKAWLVVSCDMPFIDEGALSFLLKNRKRDKLVTCFLDTDNQFPEPMVAVWEPGCLPLLREHIHSDLRPRKFIMENPSEVVRAPDEKWLQNINTYEGFRKVLSIIANDR